jgi:tetratricopeptide (TPR) repeat protein
VIEEAELGRLEALVGDDPGAAAFPALAEALRQSGRPEDAERVARDGLVRRPDTAAGRAALALALLDLGREAEARAELARVLEAAPGHPLVEHFAPPRARVVGFAPPPPPAPEAGGLELIGEGEIEDAFALARPEAEEPRSADEVVASALEGAELDEPDEPDTRHELDDDTDPLRGELPVATHTVAALLERQGHAERAERMRASLSDSADAEREHVLATLERWLENLGRRRT